MQYKNIFKVIALSRFTGVLNMTDKESKLRKLFQIVIPKSCPNCGKRSLKKENNTIRFTYRCTCKGNLGTSVARIGLLLTRKLRIDRTA